MYNLCVPPELYHRPLWTCDHTLGNHYVYPNFFQTPGSSNMAQAIRLAQSDQFIYSRGERSQAADVLVLITDGSTEDVRGSIQAADQAKASGVNIIVVGLSSLFRLQDVIDITNGQRNENYLLLSDYSELYLNIAQMVQYISGANCE